MLVQLTTGKPLPEQTGLPACIECNYRELAVKAILYHFNNKISPIVVINPQKKEK